MEVKVSVKGEVKVRDRGTATWLEIRRSSDQGTRCLAEEAQSNKPPTSLSVFSLCCLHAALG